MSADDTVQREDGHATGQQIHRVEAEEGQVLTYQAATEDLPANTAYTTEPNQIDALMVGMYSPNIAGALALNEQDLHKDRSHDVHRGFLGC